jgi:hypothetical protein
LGYEAIIDAILPVQEKGRVGLGGAAQRHQ